MKRAAQSTLKSWWCLALVALMLSVAVPGLCFAQSVLKGGVEEENLRLNPDGLRGGAQRTPQSDGLRLNRAPMQGSAVDSTAFAGPSAAPLNGTVDSNDFAKPPKNFDIGADRGSREMVLAWERWHKQLSGAIYGRWQRIAQQRGRATIKVTVTRDHHIMAQVLRCDGGSEFENEVLLAINSLEGNPGLTFPSNSERQQVSFEADYIADTNVTPGFSWVKNDYEHVQHGY